MPNLLKVALGFLLILSTQGCTTHSVTSEEFNFPLTSVFSAVEKAMSMGVDHYSENHREFYSRPFLVKQTDETIKSGYRDRGKAKVVVLGETRPYTIEVEVSIERSLVKKPQSELKDDDYAFDHYDKRLATRLITSITAIMDKRERQNNFIDDFRSF